MSINDGQKNISDIFAIVNQNKPSQVRVYAYLFNILFHLKIRKFYKQRNTRSWQFYVGVLIYGYLFYFTDNGSCSRMENPLFFVLFKLISLLQYCRMYQYTFVFLSWSRKIRTRNEYLCYYGENSNENISIFLHGEDVRTSCPGAIASMVF